MMEMGNAAQIGAFVTSLLALAISVISARSKGVHAAVEGVRALASGKADKDDLSDLFARMHRSEAKVAALETEVEHLPNKDTAHRMEMAVARLEGRLEAMDERLKPVAAMASRMQEVMMEGRAR